MEKLKNITPAEFRCGTVGTMCPAVFKSEDGKQYIIIGEFRNDVAMMGPVGETESAVEISADLLEASLGLPDLIKAAEMLVSFQPGVVEEISDAHNRKVLGDVFDALRSALTRAKGAA